jgi:decaprenyl-phosphate phosphoribosyltransferase
VKTDAGREGATALSPSAKGWPLALLRACRPRQWAKNVLVFAAPAAAEVLDERDAFVKSVIAFIAFCMASSAVYLTNDLADVDADRSHPVKRLRPIASGALPVPLARTAVIVLVPGSLFVALLTGEWRFAAVVALYLVTSFAYSAWLKHVAILDLVIVAMGFLLRAIGGALAVDVPVSEWFLIVFSFGSLFVVAGKRFAELLEFGEQAGTLRPTLDGYTLSFLRMVMGTAAAATSVAYCTFAFEKAATAAPGGAVWFQLSAIPVVTALLRYALVVEQGHGGAPEDVFLYDRLLQVLMVSFLVLFGVGVVVG